MSSEFPLFRLPLIVLNHGLKLMTPFEIGRDEIGFSRNDLFVTSWIPTEEDTPQEQIRENNSTVNQYLKVYISNDYDIFILRKYINHLSYIFNITLTNLELHFQDFTRDENKIIIDSYCGNRRDTNCAKSLKLIGESVNTPDDDEVVDHILSRQEAKCELTLNIKPTSKFLFRGDLLRYSINQLIVRNSDWLTCGELRRFDSFAVWIYNSKINPFNIEFMINQWYSGWTPNWTLIMIEFPFVDIDYCTDEFRERFSECQLLRSEKTIEGPDGLSDRIKYSIRRGDGTIGEFLVENNKYLYIKMRDNTDISLSTFISMTKSMM